MNNLIRMDLYRMRKLVSFKVCLLITFVLALGQTPLLKVMADLARSLDPSANITPVPAAVALSGILNSPFSFLGGMLSLLSISFFYYGDLEFGYIKNIAGQMPKKGYTVLSKFLCSIPHHLLFMLAGVIGSALGSLMIQRITLDDQVVPAILYLLLKLLLIMGVSSVLLLAVAAFRSKSLGLVLAVLFGTGMASLIYSGINSGLSALGIKSFDFGAYMPDTLMGLSKPDVLTSLLVSAGFIAVFLLLSIRIFDKKDIK